MAIKCNIYSVDGMNVDNDFISKLKTISKYKRLSITRSLMTQHKGVAAIEW